MSPLIRKEIRLLLSSWMAALAVAVAAALAVAPAPHWLMRFLDPEELAGWNVAVFGATILALALSPFGQEASYGTLALLLVQPEERRRLWKIKTDLLAVALASVWLLFALCLWTRHGGLTSTDWLELWTHGGLIVLALSGGLWSTLFLRDVGLSFACACIVPATLSAGTFLIASHWVDSGHAMAALICSVLAIYAVAGVFWARRLFLGAEDVAYAGAHFSLPRFFVAPASWLAFRGKENRWIALVKKELRLQEAAMLVIPMLALFSLALLVMRHFVPHWATRGDLMEGISILWLILAPIIIGCSAVAEERRLNTLANSLCLPICWLGQFGTKLGVTLVLGIVFGALAPRLLAFILGVSPMRGSSPGDLVEIAAAITGLGFYASSMSRGLLQSLTTAICVPGFIWVLLLFSYNLIAFLGNPALEVISAVTLICPTLGITALCLAFHNYKLLQIDWRVPVGNFIRAGAVFTCVTLASIAVFDRSWELFLPLEPPHGQARLSGPGRPGLWLWGSNLSVWLPEGRIWIGKWDPARRSISGGFVPGSNWGRMAPSSVGVMAVQPNGTLWRIFDKTDLRQIGSDADWKKVAAGYRCLNALKQDGSFWIASCVSNAVGAPVRVGADSDWVDLQGGILVKRDGSRWCWQSPPFGPRGQKVPEAKLQRLPPSEQKFNQNFSPDGLQFSLGVAPDGSLRGHGFQPRKLFGERVQHVGPGEEWRVGTKSDWISLSESSFQTGDALEADGTLWTMTMPYYKGRRASHYTDWVAATESDTDRGGLTFALARDGTLSGWDVSGIYWFDSQPRTFMRRFLGPSRRPVFSGNIFAEQ
jgi:hypothetical protein